MLQWWRPQSSIQQSPSWCAEICGLREALLSFTQDESDDAMQDAEASPMRAAMGQQMAMMAVMT